MTSESKAKPEEAEAETPAAEETGQKPEAKEPTDKLETSDPVAESSAEKADPDAPADNSEVESPGLDPADDPVPDSENENSETETAEAEKVEALAGEVADLKDRLLRAAAEMENMRRRFEREMADARQYAVTGFAREVLSIGDNLGRALSAVPEDARKESETMATLLEGVEMTERELLRVLDKHNVKRLEPHGEKFDPNFHQAMFEVEHEDAPHGTVVQVVQPGYSIGERVLRPAMVGVAKKKKAEKQAAKAETPETTGGTEESAAASGDAASKS